MKKAQVQKEIEDIHAFFVDWFKGALPQTPESFARFDQVMDKKFTIVFPDGVLMDRATLMSRIEAAHAAYRDRTFEIQIKNCRLTKLGDDHLLALYEEWQQAESNSRGRQSCVVFARDADAPRGLRWLHVHETWLQP